MDALVWPVCSAALNKIPYDPHLNLHHGLNNILYCLSGFLAANNNVLVNNHNFAVDGEAAHCVGHQSHSSYCLPLPSCALYLLGSLSEDVTLTESGRFNLFSC